MSDPTPQVHTIEALRSRGAPAHDPVRWHYIEALSRRTQDHHGATRQLLDDKLQRLLAACAATLDHAAVPTTVDASAAKRTPLSDLLADMAHRATDGSSPVELRSIAQHQQTWSRLSVERRMTQAQKLVPENAGPLNTQRLLHLALTRMRAVSPDYAHRCIQHVEALLQLDQVLGPELPPKREMPPRTRERKTSGTRPV